MDHHQANVIVLSRRIASFYERKEAYRIYHGSTNSTRNVQIDRRNMVDTSHLNRILKINKGAKTVLVEPNVPMDELVAFTTIHGLMPPVVMEFPGITVGGGYSGTSGESSSFKYGFFDKTINWVEFVLPDGQIVGASATERSDLFYGAAGAFGTMGVATAFEIQLVDAKSYVEITLTPCESASRTLGAVDDAAEDPSYDYVDGVILAKDSGVLITGKLTNVLDPAIPVRRFSRATDPWFYLHVERATRKRLSSAGPIVEAVPLADYLFRYDRGTFWTGRYAFNYFSVPFNRITRWALNDVLKTRRMYHAFHKAGLTDQYIVQDLALPASRAQQFLEYLDEDFAIYPLWLCPLQAPSRKSMHPHPRPGPEEDVSEEPMMNFGVWGPGPTKYSAFVNANRRLEAKVAELGGMKWLYAQAFYTEEEFWAAFDREWYDGLRQKYKADHLPSVFDKVKTDFPQREGESERNGIGRRLSKKIGSQHAKGVYGAAHSLTKKDYLLTGKGA